MTALMKKIRLYWTLTKSLQTTLLLATGLAGYMSARCPVFNLGTRAAPSLICGGTATSTQK
jgi:heme O synthase-like polyprenyltransferase